MTLGEKLCLFTSPIVPGTDRKILNRLRRTALKRATTIAADWNQAREVFHRAGFTLADLLVRRDGLEQARAPIASGFASRTSVAGEEA
jgi:hypothetical protein